MTDMMKQFPRTVLDPARKTGLIVCGMGGPDGPDAVRPFLRNLFRDPLIFPVPRAVAGLAGAMIAWKRAPEVRKRYAMVSKKSITPQLGTTKRQGEILARTLTDAGCPTVSRAAMRYWRPYPDAAVRELLDEGAEQFVVLPMYPQYADATNGSTIAFVIEGIRAAAPQAPIHAVPDWHDLPGLLTALAKSAVETLSGWAAEGADPRECVLAYVAHSLPQKFVDAGDPYLDRTLVTVRGAHDLVAAGLREAGHGAFLDGLLAGGPEPLVTFQSKVGPIRWLGPQLEEETPRLGERGCRRLFVQPVSFTCEHIETLLELDVELKETAEAAGITVFKRGFALNLDAGWLDSLAGRLLTDAFGAKERDHASHA